MHVPDDGAKASRISKVHDKIVIHGMDCEYQVKSRKGPVGVWWLVHPPQLIFEKWCVHEEPNLGKW